MPRFFTASVRRRRIIKYTIGGILGGAAATSLYIDHQWQTFQNASRFANPSIAGGKGGGGASDAPSSFTASTVAAGVGVDADGAKRVRDGLAGYHYTAYNNPAEDVLKEPIVQYPSLSEAQKQQQQQRDQKDAPPPAAAVDVCIVGGGFSGLHTALSLIEKDNEATAAAAKNKKGTASACNGHQQKTIAILEANRIGSGASGMCGGMAIVGFETEVELLEALVGPVIGQQLFRQSIMGYERLKGLIHRYKIQCGMVEGGLLEMMLAKRFPVVGGASEAINKGSNGGGIISDGSSSSTAAAAAYFDAAAVAEEMAEVAHECAEEERHYGQIARVVSKEEVASGPSYGLSSDRFAYGCFNPRTFSVNPLALVFGLARALCVSAGRGRAAIYERSEVVSVEREVLSEAEQRRLKAIWERREAVSGAVSGLTAADSREDIRLAATFAKYGAGDFIVTTADGASLKAKEVLIATNSVPWKLRPSLAMCTTPCTTSIMLTKPFPKTLLDAVFSYKGCVIDERFGLVYFRRVAGDRVLFGGLASGMPFCPQGTGPAGGMTIVPRGDVSSGSTAVTPPESLVPFTATGGLATAGLRLAAEFAATFPSLAPHLGIQECWEGRVEHRETMFPLVGRDEGDGLWYSVGFSGHGVVPTCTAGDVVASALHSMVHPADEQSHQTANVAAAATDGAGAPLSSSLLLEPRDTRYQLWREVSMLPSRAFTRNKAAVEEALSSALPSSSSSSSSSSDSGSDQQQLVVAAALALPPRIYESSSSSSSPSVIARYTPMVMPPAGFPMSSVIPYVFIDFCLPLWEWWTGAI